MSKQTSVIAKCRCEFHLRFAPAPRFGPNDTYWHTRTFTTTGELELDLNQLMCGEMIGIGGITRVKFLITILDIHQPMPPFAENDPIECDIEGQACVEDDFDFESYRNEFKAIGFQVPE